MTSRANTDIKNPFIPELTTSILTRSFSPNYGSFRMQAENKILKLDSSFIRASQIKSFT